MMSKKIKKKEKALLLIVIFQILLMVTLTFADSYTIHKTDPIIENSIIKDKKENNDIKNLITSGINLLIGFLSIKQVGIVSAQEGVYCCLETCQDVTNIDECSGNSLPTKCESTNECKLGTCVDQEHGTCSAQSPKSQCETGGEVVWYSEPINALPQCQTGCCTLENGAYKQFTRKIQCINQGGIFDPSIPQSECRIYTEQMGACVLNNNGCQFVAEETCENILNGNFHQGLLCSNPDLGTICSMPKAIGEIQTTCPEGREIYFVDSCGNRANVYDANKWNIEEYWKFVQAPTCNSVSNPTTCGNCDGLSSICASSSEAGVKPTYGNYACKDITCIDENGETKKSGEAWCVYEGYVGGEDFSSNVIGGQHWKVYCDKGKIKIDSCDPYGYRGRICGEKTIEGMEGSLSIARCRFNEGWKCFNVELESYEYDDDGEIIDEDGTRQRNKEDCEEFSDCRLQSVNVDDYFKFDACVPKYPPGLNFWSPEEITPGIKNNAKNICGIASVKCTIVERKGIGGWKCKGNCECLEQSFTEQMNDFCVSLGDCGGYINVEGEYTKNFKVRVGEDSISDSKKREYLSMLTKENTENNTPAFFSSTEQGYFGGDPLGEIDWLGEEFGGLKIFMTIAGSIGVVVASVAGFELVKWILVASISFPGWGTVIFLFLAIIFIFLKLFGIGKTRERTISFECLPWQPPKGGDDCEKCNKGELPCTEYKCRSLGSACRLIDENELYEAENPVCINKYPNDNVPPQITLEEIDRSVYEVTNRPEGDGIQIRTSGGECIQEFTPVNFSLITKDNGNDDYAKCVYNWYHAEPDPTRDYENVMDGELFKEINSYSITHTFENRLPFVTNEYVSDVTGNLGERTGQLNMYVRCEDFAGNFNFNEYIINFCIKEGPDNTAARIMKFDPKNKSFLAYNETTKPLIISLDEPAECKWSKTRGKLYDEMTDFELCEDYTGEVKSRWDCATRLTNLTEPVVNNIYIKCKDQPWICDSTQEDCDYTGPWAEEDRNVNTEDFLYVLYSTQNPLNITSISPQGEIKGGGNIFEIISEATTSGGINKGIAMCKYRFIESPSGINSGDFFFETNSTRHRQPLSPPAGNYNIAIECNDEAGNKATGNSIFNLIVDSAAPRIVRSYKSGSSLKLITDEPAQCYYSLVSCNFNFEDKNVVSITTAYSTEHTADWNKGQKYYIKCEDTWENRNPGCAIIVSPA